MSCDTTMVSGKLHTQGPEIAWGTTMTAEMDGWNWIDQDMVFLSKLSLIFTYCSSLRWSIGSGRMGPSVAAITCK